MEQLINSSNNPSYYYAPALARLKKMATNRIASSLISDPTTPYGLDRVINVSGNPRCVILDSDGNIVVSSNKNAGVSAQRIHVFRYNDGEHLKSMHATSNSIGEIVFRNDKTLVFLEDRDITFLNYSNGKMNKQIFKPNLSYHTITFDKNKKNIIMGLNRFDNYAMRTFHGLVMIDADNGR